MPKSFIPKLLTSETANKLADLRLIQEDLQHVRECCALILKEQHCILTSTKGRAFLDSLVIRYRRCFASGIRTKLKLELLTLDEDQLELHNFFYGIAGKHIAHAVNNFELNGTTIHIAVDEDGNIVRGGLGNQGFRTLNLSMQKIDSFEIYLEALLEKVKEFIQISTEAINAEVAAMTDDELQNLPEGFAPCDHTDVTKSRKWPKK